MNTVISSIWWVFGFYWIVTSGQAFLQDFPRLYWSTVVFLAVDMFFVIFCVVVAFIALFCIAPVLLFASASSIDEGASEERISSLPKHAFHHSNTLSFSAGMGSDNSIKELPLQQEDSVTDCCVCLSGYVDGAQLYRLPCDHLFTVDASAGARWLRINATCPLCKANILGGDTLV